MITSMPIVAVTLRALLDRRRFWLMVLLAAVPVLIVVAVVIWGRGVPMERLFDDVIVATVMPLIALVFGTSAIGSELDDGTMVYLLAKPIARVRIVLPKAFVAAGISIALVVTATVLTGAIAMLRVDDVLDETVAYAIAVAVGCAAYTTAFMALSSFTSRALAIGLAYVLLWEGVLSGLFEGTRVFSIRQATLGLAAELDGQGNQVDLLDSTTAVVVLGAVILGSLALTTWRLSRYQLRGGD